MSVNGLQNGLQPGQPHIIRDVGSKLAHFFQAVTQRLSAGVLRHIITDAAPRPRGAALCIPRQKYGTPTGNHWLRISWKGITCLWCTPKPCMVTRRQAYQKKGRRGKGLPVTLPITLIRPPRFLRRKETDCAIMRESCYIAPQVDPSLK